MGKGLTYAIGAGIAGTAGAIFLGPGAVFVGGIAAVVGGVAGMFASEEDERNRRHQRLERRQFLFDMMQLRKTDFDTYLLELDHINKELRNSRQAERDGFCALLREAEPTYAAQLLSDADLRAKAKKEYRRRKLERQRLEQRAHAAKPAPNYASVVGVLVVLVFAATIGTLASGL